MVFNEKEVVNRAISIHIDVVKMDNKYTYPDIQLTKENYLCYYLS